MNDLAAKMGLRRGGATDAVQASGKQDAAKPATVDADAPRPPAPTLFSLIQACPHVDLPVCTCSSQLLPDTRTSFMPELDRSACQLHQRFVTRPDRVKEREPSQWMDAAVVRRVEKKYTPTVVEIFPGVNPTVISRQRAHELIEAYTEVRGWPLLQRYHTASLLVFHDGMSTFLGCLLLRPSLLSSAAT
jgi:hypothetical protein